MSDSHHDRHARGTGLNKPTAPEVRHVRSVLFVCLGNICRSPLAQGVLEHRATAMDLADDLRIASCGTGSWHIGSAPDPRSIAVARKNGIRLASRGRQVDPATDFATFDLIVPMDRANERDLLRLGCPADKLALCLAFVGPDTDALARSHGYEVPDPYHDGEEGFDTVFRLIDSAAAGMLEAIAAGRGS